MIRDNLWFLLPLIAHKDVTESFLVFPTLFFYFIYKKFKKIKKEEVGERGGERGKGESEGEEHWCTRVFAPWAFLHFIPF